MGKNWLQDLAKIKTTFVKEYISEADCIILVFKEPFHYKNGTKHNNWYYEVPSFIFLRHNLLLIPIVIAYYDKYLRGVGT
jgi:hypothetical protein